MAQMVATAAPAANPPGAKTPEQESTNRQGEHKDKNGREITCKEAGHDAPFVVCTSTHHEQCAIR